MMTHNRLAGPVGALCLMALLMGARCVARVGTRPPAAGSSVPFAVAAAPGSVLPLGLGPQSGPAALVTIYVHTLLAPRVLHLEHAWALVNHQVQVYCVGRHLGIAVCFDGGVNAHDAATLTLAEVLRQQALLLSGTSHDLATDLAALRLESPVITAQMDALLEDLALCSEQLILLLQEYSQPLLALNQIPATVSGVDTALRGLGYGARARSVVAVLRRAEGWLETIDQETGARVRLPGFERGAPPVEATLSSP
jgi:hypothetical protein